MNTRPLLISYIGFALLLFASGCTGALRQSGQKGAPYPQSRLISEITWDFSTITSQRKAKGSDLWPCTWAADGDLYCAWGDGGGFDGNDDNIGRVSLGFAHIQGVPSVEDPNAVVGKNIWGSPPYAQVAASFGGKVGSMTAVKGVLYASGGFWTRASNPDPVHVSGRGPLSTLAWSTDSARSWQIAPWVSAEPLGSFLDEGQDSLEKTRPYLLLYYMRNADNHHLYLKRIRSDSLQADPATGHSFQYFSGVSWFTRHAQWSEQESAAKPIFTDGNNVEGPSAVYDAGLQRYLLTTGHYSSGNDDDSSAGQVGIFEAPHPWGPWATVGYYENWANTKEETTGDYLSLRIPSKWISADGKTLWAVFSGLHSFDSFNVVRAELNLR